MEFHVGTVVAVNEPLQDPRTWGVRGADSLQHALNGFEVLDPVTTIFVVHEVILEHGRINKRQRIALEEGRR